MSLVMMPNKQNVDIAAVYGETEEEVQFAQWYSLQTVYSDYDPIPEAD